MEGLQIYPSSVEITSIENVSWNMNNERNEVYCIETLKKYQEFYPCTWRGKVKNVGLQWHGWDDSMWMDDNEGRKMYDN